MSSSCIHCGLGGEYLGTGGVKPWGRPPLGKERAALELEERWKVLIATDLADEKAREEYLQFAFAAGLHDRAARLARFFAQDHLGTPQGDAAAMMLASVVEKMHAVFLVRQGGGSRDVMVERTKTIMKWIYVVVALMCAGVCVLFLLFFMKT